MLAKMLRLASRDEWRKLRSGLAGLGYGGTAWLRARRGAPAGRICAREYPDVEKCHFQQVENALFRHWEMTVIDETDVEGTTTVNEAAAPRG